MKFQQGDILIRKDTVWLSHKLISNVCGFSDDYFRKIRAKYKASVQACHRHHNILPDNGKSWRCAKINNSFYYALKNIPNRKPTFYRDLFGDRAILIDNYNEFVNNNQSSLIEIQFKHYVNTVYKDYLYEYIEVTEVQRIALAKACAVVDFTANYIFDNNIKGNNIYKKLCAIVEDKDMRYIPKNYRKFKEKVERILDGEQITEVIQLPRSGNRNATTFDDPIIKAWALKLRSMSQNYTNEYITRKIQELCQLTGKRIPSRRWFGKNIYESHKTKFLTASNRFGKGSSKAFSNEGYIPMDTAIFSGDCWQIDATRVNIIEHKKDTGDKGFLFIVAVKDVHSGDILGYSFDYSENRWSVTNAIKMAVQTSGYLPYEIVADRFPGHNTDEVKRLIERLRMLGVKYTTTHKATGKPHVERGFSTLQTVFMQESKYYYGEGVKSRRLSAHRSPEYLKEIRKQANQEQFGLTEAYNEATAIVEAYKETPLSYYSRKHQSVNKSPKMLHAESEKPHVHWVEDHQTSMLFDLKKKVMIKNNGMIRTTIQGADYVYHVHDYSIYSELNSVIMSYDMQNLDRIYLFKPNNHFLIHLGTAELFKKPQPYGPQAEYNRIAIEKQRLKEINDRKALELTELTANANEVELLMGRFTRKNETENMETLRLMQSLENEPLKKAVGSDFDPTNSLDIDINKLTRNQL